VSDMNNTTALTSAQNAGQYASAQFVNTADPWTHEIKAETRNLMTWTSTGTSPTYVMAMKLYFTGIAPSTSYGVTFLRYLIQFRGTID